MSLTSELKMFRSELQTIIPIKPEAQATWDMYRVDPVSWVSECFGLTLDSWQQETLTSTSRRILLNCSRQSGKSFVSALLALHTAIYKPYSLILCLSPTLRQSGELFHTISQLYGVLQDPIPSEAESALKLELANGSRIISLPGQENTVRCYAGVSLLVIDEAARVLDDLYYSVRPMLAVSNARLIALSTPFGKRGWWHDAWTSQESWLRVEVPASQCPRISKEFLEEERRVLGEWWFRQEYECQFSESEDSVFPSDTINKIFEDNDIQPLFGGKIF